MAARLDCVVPSGMKVIAGDVQFRHRGVADLDALLVGPPVELAFDFQSGLGGCGADQLDDGDAFALNRMAWTFDRGRGLLRRQ